MRSLKDNLIGSIFFLVLLFGALWASLALFPPAPRTESSDFVRNYDSGPMLAALDPGAIDAIMGELEAVGPRVLGLDSHGRAAAFIESQYRAAGLDVFQLDGDAVAPVTSIRRIEDESGDALPGVEIYPFLPNSFQPVMTPPGGLNGELVLLNEESLRNRRDFTGTIGVLNLDDVPASMGLEWTRYAERGISGLLLVHPEGMKAMPWRRISQATGIQSTLPVNFLRAAASEKLLQYLGKTVRLDVQVRFKQVPSPALVGILRSGAPAREALVLTVPYDQYGILPDYEVNNLQSFPLATHLALVKGFSHYKGQLERDVIFVATGAQYAGFACLDHLLRMIGPAGRGDSTADRLAGDIEVESRNKAVMKRLLEWMNTPGFLSDTTATVQGFEALPPAERRVFTEQLRFVLNTKVFELAEDLLQKRIEFERGDTNQLQRPEYEEFLKAQRAHDDMATAAGLPLERILDRRAHGLGPESRFVEVHDLRGLLIRRISELRDFHTGTADILKQGADLNRVFSAYKDLYVISPSFLPRLEPDSAGMDRVSFVLGGAMEIQELDRASRVVSPGFAAIIDNVVQQAGLSGSVSLQSPVGESQKDIYRHTASFPTPTGNWSAMGYRAFSLIQTDRLRTYRNLPEPFVGKFPSAASMEPSLQLAGELSLALAQGLGNIALPPRIHPRQYSGRVYASDVGRSLVPNFPVAGALVASKPNLAQLRENPGRYSGLRIFTDPYGRYSLLDASSRLSFPGGGKDQFNPQAVVYGSDGLISYIKDESPATQSLYRSIGLSELGGDFRGVNLVVFRASPVAILDLVNPQTLRPFSSVELIAKGSLTSFRRFNKVGVDGASLSFIPPGAYFFATFRSGTPENDLVQTVRSFMSGDPSERPSSGDSIEGDGYLAVDHPILVETANEQASSMQRVNESRIRLQGEKGMADPHTLDFHARSAQLLEKAADSTKQLSFFERMLAARDSLTYSVIVHPILRRNINEAVISILWYMALLIPFMFFFEKLVFAFSDIRKQLAAQAAIFLVVFLLLKLLHPAFEIIRSSLMILLGFFILMISLAITLLFAGKFRENLEEIKQRRGRVTDAEVNSMGVIGTAFLLGINNMHRRKVRTGLTCLTLVLITFAMICFTSIYSDFEDSETALGPAAYQGLLVKNEKFLPISAAERFALETRYGSSYPVAPRSMYVGRVNVQNERMNPRLEAEHKTPDGRVRNQFFGSIISFAHNEPLRGQLKFVTKPYWFEKDLDDRQILPVMIPQSMAEALDISVDEVNAGTATLRINGTPFRVGAIFEEASYAAMRDLDGRPILPFDVRGLGDVERIPGRSLDVLGDEDGVLIPPSEIILAPHVNSLGISVAEPDFRLVSLALDLESASLREAKNEVMRFLEQRARPAFYGVDGTAFRGARMRVSNFSGLVELVIPLVIAALTVLNTMKGSVYERRDEIFVYNAVGIAPKFIFAMFFAEAFVYAVVGCVAGYLLSQGTGMVLTSLDLTGGLNMTFASINSIYASLAVVAAVFISTYFPAKSAMEIAAPAEESGWKMPEPEEDTFHFELPFTFDRRERVAVLAFFNRFLLDHGEGGAGNFSAGPPRFDVRGVSGGGSQSVAPSISATIWLKPYDLGVSQTLLIETPFDPTLGEFTASMKLIRKSGTRESWVRVNRNFLIGVRKQFLHWRAVPPSMKNTLFEEARQQMALLSASEDVDAPLMAQLRPLDPIASTANS